MRQAASEKEWMESADVARELGVTPAMVRVLARRQLLVAAIVTPRGGRLFRRTEVLAFKKAYRPVDASV